jgi:hypothetical protein
MQKTITNYYSFNSQSVAIKVYNNLYSYLKNRVFSKNTITPKYKQKLITDYYAYVPKKHLMPKIMRQPLITEFYHKN